MTRKEFEVYYARYQTTITAIARKLAGRDDELVRDLEQEGAFVLWKLKPEKAKRNLDAFVRQAIKNRMIDFLRKYNPRAFESLDARLEHGDQVEYDPSGSGMVLRTTFKELPRLHDEEE